MSRYAYSVSVVKDTHPNVRFKCVGVLAFPLPTPRPISPEANLPGLEGISSLSFGTLRLTASIKFAHVNYLLDPFSETYALVFGQ